MRYGRIGRRDANEPDIVEALEAIGCTVKRMHDTDLLVGFRGLNFLFEVKDGRKPPSRRKLTDHQIIQRDGWRGQYAVVYSPEQAVQTLQMLTRWDGANT